MDGALSYFFKCLAYDEKQKSKKFIAMDCDNISIILIDKKDFVSAITYSQRALSLKKELKDTAGLLKTYLNIGSIYDGKKDYVEAVKQLSVALKLADPKKNIFDYAKIINNMGTFYSCLRDYKNATLYLNKSLEIKKQLGDRSGEASTLGNLGGLYYNQQNYGKAAEYYAQSEKIAVETGDLEYQKNAHRTLTECYIRLNKNTNALTSFQKLMLIQDSLYNATSIKQATEIQVKYETEKKEQENKLLQQQNDIKTLENENNQQKLKVRNQTILILIGAFIVALIIVFWQISLARIKKQKRELETEKKLQQDRERISRDLHDNVGGQLSYVLFSLEANEEVSADKRKEKAANLSTAIRSVTGNLRETIWALNNEKLSLEKLSDKLKTYTKNMFSYSSTKIKFEEHIENDTELNPAFALNLFRICQEVVNNAFKYAQATELKISIHKNDKTTITISDNGIGFIEENNGAETFGLTNLKSRVLEINADLRIITKPGTGTTVTLIV
jgi:signal transduction histidine kinase